MTTSPPSVPLSGSSQPWAVTRKSKWCYLNNADHDDANPRGENVFLKQILQHRQAALQTERR